MTEDKAREEKVERLKCISLFDPIRHDEKAMLGIASLFRAISFPKGHTVITEGDEGDEIYVIKSGTVSVEKRTAQGEAYTVVELSAPMNIFFGEIALLDSEKRSATVVCVTDCTFYILGRDQFLAYGNENPAAALAVTRQLSRILCNRLRKANADIITLFDALVEEVEQAGGMSEDGSASA
ncbi:MAG: cyclic nucleotide-binding domain-containing protein [Chitinivibrionales bacterium]|nr:cyclic nucleotide-binding domain-containing protein [Chitinivibrionales bacterium]MBD3356057.1 cyclic nucleotide-binding domain-containing protein [Chitinivibrionales bacterium]